MTDYTWGDVDRWENGAADDSDDGYSWEGVGDALHEFRPDDSGRCTGGWYGRSGDWVACLSTQRSSVLHDDADAQERERHWHDGGDCMCYED